MTGFTILATGPLTAEPIEELAATASDAVLQSNRLRRLGGKLTKVEVLGAHGRAISPEALLRLANVEGGAAKS